MIAIDSSAVVAILTREPDELHYLAALRQADARLLSAANYLECAMVLIRVTGHRGRLDEWIEHFSVDVVPLDHH
jgi:ribonuclease VapC